MAPPSFFLQRLIRLSFRSRPTPRPPSTVPANSPVQDDTYAPSSETEYTVVVDFNPDIWREILSYCEVIDIVHVSMTCRSLASVTAEDGVWYSALLWISHNRRLPHLRAHIKSLSNADLRRKAVLLARLDQLPCGLHRAPSYYTTTRLSLPVSSVWAVSFLPGGEWMVVLCRKAGRDGVMLCRADDPSGQPSTYSPVPGGNLTDVCVFTSDQGDLLMVLRSDRPSRTRLGVYLIHLSEDDPPRLEKIRTFGIQNFENFSALGSYIVYGWIDRSQKGPRHLIKVLKFESYGCKVREYSTIKVGWDTGKYSHSYALRTTDSQITVIVSSTTLVAAYKVPPAVPASTFGKPAAVEPFWHFPCRDMHPRAVHLVPSLPVVDTPSIAIFYRDRCLFILPGFDADPPGVHPTYFSTYRCSRDFKSPMLLGPQRAFWDLGHGRVGIGLLPAPLQPAFYDHDAWDITGANVPEADLADLVHPVVYTERYHRRVARAAWDEESGKLALFPKPEFPQGEDVSVVSIVDFMH